MKILYIAPVVPQSSASDGGYSGIAYSFDMLFKNMLERKELDDYTVINPSIQKESVVLNSPYDFGLILTHPDSFKNENYKKCIESARKACKKFYLHVFWECDRLPDSWNTLFKSDLFDGFISSSDFVKNIIQSRLDELKSNQSNFKVYPVLYKDDYKDWQIDIKKKENENVFTVLYVGQYTKRKGMEDAIAAFAHALGDRQDCKLILKYHRLSKIEWSEEDMIKRTIAMNCRDFKAHVYEITENLNRDQIRDLYKESSIILHPSRGEGFGLVIVESGIVGIPIIYADNSSCNEVLGSNTSIPINCTFDTAVGMSHYNYSTDSNYGIPHMREMISAIIREYDCWKTNRKEYYEFDGSETIFNKFSEEVVIEQIKKLV